MLVAPLVFLSFVVFAKSKPYVFKRFLSCLPLYSYSVIVYHLSILNAISHSLKAIVIVVTIMAICKQWFNFKIWFRFMRAERELLKRKEMKGKLCLNYYANAEIFKSTPIKSQTLSQDIRTINYIEGNGTYYKKYLSAVINGKYSTMFVCVFSNIWPLWGLGRTA